MKKICSIFVLLLIILLSSISFAKVGDKKGKYYSTDIITYLNGREIESINIGGWTLIKAEDMQYFGFYVVYNNDERVLSIDQNIGKIDEKYVASNKSSKDVGKPIGYYYETDIKTYLDNNIITAYNTNGTTWIWAEEMRNFGYDVVWSATERTLSIYSPKLLGYQYNINVSDSTVTFNGDYNDDSKGQFSLLWKNGNLELKDDARFFNTNLNYDGINYILEISFYQNQGLFNFTTLQKRLDSFAYQIFDEKLKEPEELYELINQKFIIRINGNLADKVEIQKYGGNGHRDYYFKLIGLPKYTESELNEIEFILAE